MLLKGASGGGGLAPPFLTLGMSSEEEDDDRLPAKIPDLDAHNPPSDDDGSLVYDTEIKYSYTNKPLRYLNSGIGKYLSLAFNWRVTV